MLGVIVGGMAMMVMAGAAPGVVRPSTTGPRRAARAGAARPSRAVRLGRAGGTRLAARADGSDDLLAQWRARPVFLKPPPTFTTFGFIPIVGASLLCKALFGSGLPGPLGLPEGLSYIGLILGAEEWFECTKGFLSSGKSVSLDNYIEHVKEASGGFFTTGQPTIETKEMRAKMKAEAEAKMTPEQRAEIEARRAREAKRAEEAVALGNRIEEKEREDAESKGGNVDLNATKLEEIVKTNVTADNYDGEINPDNLTSA